MITVIRNAISEAMGMAVRPVSYTCRAIDVGRIRRQLVQARKNVSVARPRKSSAIFTLTQRRVTMRPSALTGSNVGSDEDGRCSVPLAGQRGFDELELPGHGARELHADAGFLGGLQSIGAGSRLPPDRAPATRER